MILDSVSVVVEYNKITNDNGEFYFNASFLEDHVYYGKGAASDAHDAALSANELNGMYKTSERHYGAVRVDYEDTLAEGLLQN